MNYDELIERLIALGVTPPDICRASLYLDYLDNARTYFYTTLATAFGGNYPFVKNALRSASLLNELAKTLDYYVCPAVNAALNANRASGWTYRQYFDNQILGDSYDTNLANFRGLYTVSAGALNLLFTHFTRNISQACERVLGDWTLLTGFFADQYQYSFGILSLDHIKSTGSDFHKGGKQVLILTFNTIHYVVVLDDIVPINQDVKVVYKPGDIEADCLIAGNSSAINKVVPHFMTASLFELYNAALRTYKTGHGAFTGEEIPTYRILPRNYASAYTGGFPMPIRNSYGYIQYLDNDLSGTAVQFFGYYPFGSSDYLIFKGQDRNAIIRKFYKIAGALTAIACTFSIQDLHVENLRVKNYLPYFIDMEISLYSATNSVKDTVLIDSENGDCLGGINGLYMYQQTHWEIRNADTPATVKLVLAGANDYFQNRLWDWDSTTTKQSVPVNTGILTEGFIDGMIILRAAQQANAFAPWFARINNVLVRNIPLTTSFFKEKLIDKYYVNDANATGATTLQVYLKKALTEKFRTYVAGDDPRFLALTPAESLVDIQNLDIPVFYYRIGMQQIINSTGAQVAIPATIDIYDNQNPPQPVTVNTHIGRTTFFANVPTTTVINVGQVQVLGGGGFDARQQLLQNSINHEMNQDRAPDPAVVVPLNN